MAKTKSVRDPDVEYVTGTITETGSIALVAADQKDEARSSSIFAIYKDGAWVRVFTEDMDVVAVVAGHGSFARYLTALDSEGKVYINSPNAVHREQVHKGKGGPSKLRPVHEVRAIDDRLIVVGMRRQVFGRAIDRGPWRRLDQGVVLPEGSTELAGFYSVDGFSKDEIYAVGLRGEIWLYGSGTWQQVDSPTNSPLLSVRCGATGDAIACGQDGIIVRGRGPNWEIVPSGEVDTALDSVLQFRQRWYFADEEGGLYVLGDNGLEPDPLFESLKVQAGTLDCNSDSLLCVGPEDLLVFDGSRWTRLPDPPIEF